MVALIAQMEAACFGSGAWSAAQVEGALSPENALQVVIPDVGYVVGVSVVDEVELHRIGVLPAARQQGAGRRLFHDFVQLARDRGAHRLFLEVREDNTAARALYASVGLGLLGRRPRYYRDGCAALVLGTDLSAWTPRC